MIKTKLQTINLRNNITITYEHDKETEITLKGKEHKKKLTCKEFFLKLNKTRDLLRKCEVKYNIEQTIQ